MPRNEARARGLDGFRFFQFALAYHYAFGRHQPGRSNIWERYLAVRETLPNQGGQRGIADAVARKRHVRRRRRIDDLELGRPAANLQSRRFVARRDIFGRKRQRGWPIEGHVIAVVQKYELAQERFALYEQAQWEKEHHR